MWRHSCFCQRWKSYGMLNKDTLYECESIVYLIYVDDIILSQLVKPPLKHPPTIRAAKRNKINKIKPRKKTRDQTYRVNPKAQVKHASKCRAKLYARLAPHPSPSLFSLYTPPLWQTQPWGSLRWRNVVVRSVEAVDREEQVTATDKKDERSVRPSSG